MSAVLALQLEGATIRDVADYCRMANKLDIPGATPVVVVGNVLVLAIPTGRIRVSKIDAPRYVSKIPPMKRAGRPRR